MIYGKFDSALFDAYASAPEEENEIYKRRYISIAQKIDSIVGSWDGSRSDESVVSGFHSEAFNKLGLHFDAIIGGRNAVVSSFAREFIAEGGSHPLPEGIPADKYADLLLASPYAVTINVPDGCEASLRILFANIDRPLAVRLYVNIGGHAKLSLLEWHASNPAESSFSGVLHEISAEADSDSELNAIYSHAPGTIALNNTDATVRRAANLRMNYVYVGGSAVRARVRATAAAPLATVRINEIALGSKEQRFDLNTNIINAAPRTDTRLISMAALQGKSICYLKGLGKVVAGAKESVSFMEERGMLIEKSARIDSLPSISIDENAVKATHSAATGPIDGEALFYLMARGVDDVAARQLLVSGFFSKALGGVRDGLALSLIHI